MPSTCASSNCNNKQFLGCGKSFHNFPKNDDLRQLWVLKVNRENFTPSSKAVLCSDHFEEACFDRTGQTIRLRSGSIPTKFKFLKKKSSVSKKKKRKKTALASVSETGASGSKTETSASLSKTETGASGSITETVASGTETVASGTETVGSGSETVGSGTETVGSGSETGASVSKSKAVACGSKTVAIVTKTGASLSKAETVAAIICGVPIESSHSHNITLDHKYAILDSPRQIKRKLDDTIDQVITLRKKLRRSQEVSRRAKQKCLSLSFTVETLKRKVLTSQNYAAMLESTFKVCS